MEEFSRCFSDYRDREAIGYTVEELLSQRIYGIALGYEDLNDYDQLRLWFSSVAYVLLNELRRVGLCSTEFSQAPCNTIRTKLLKIGARVKVSVRRIAVCLSSAYPYKEIFQLAFKNIRKAYPMLC